MKTIASELVTARSASKTVVRETSRLLFIDNIRIFLTMLVIAHHMMVIYTGSGGWLYYDSRQDDITAAIGGWFCAVNQSYFMGLFLFVAAYFVPGAYDRKGPGKFLKDRLVRLGIPLVVYSWLLRPLFLYFGMKVSFRSYWNWYTGEYFRVYGLIGGGPLWFIEALLLFSLLYGLYRLLSKARTSQTSLDGQFPAAWKIALFGLLLGTASFLVRLVSPVNDTFRPLNFQFANFPQYVALFTLGLVAYRRNWLTVIPPSTGRRWLGIAVVIILIYGPLAILGGATENEEPFLGGWYWQSLLFAMWDAFLCLSMCIGLLSLFQRRLNRQGSLTHELSRSAYAAYLIHEPAITYLAMITASIYLHPLLKFIATTILFIPVCFGLGSLVRRIPYLDRVL